MTFSSSFSLSLACGKGVLHKGRADSSFAEVLPYEQLAPGSLAASPQPTLQLEIFKNLNPKGN